MATLVDCNDPFVGNNHKAAALEARAQAESLKAAAES